MKSKVEVGVQLEGRCCVCGHLLSHHIDETNGWRCHSLGPDFYQCECFLRKKYDDIRGYDVKKRLSEQLAERKLGGEKPSAVLKEILGGGGGDKK